MCLSSVDGAERFLRPFHRHRSFSRSRQRPPYLHLSWADLAENEEGYRIYRKAFDDPFEVVAEVLADQTEFYDGNVEMGIVYTYYLVAFTSAGESAPSNEVSGELTLEA